MNAGMSSHGCDSCEANSWAALPTEHAEAEDCSIIFGMTVPNDYPSWFKPVISVRDHVL